jgi:hypothetical protein
MRTVGIWATLALASCGSNSATDYPSFRNAATHLYCQHAADCGMYDPAYLAQCQQSLGDSQTGYDPSKISFDSGAAQGCLDALKAALGGCSTTLDYANMMLVDACKSVFTGKSPAGSPCPNFIECAPGSQCSIQFGGTHCTSMCEALGPIGSTCNTSNCATGGFCDNTKKMCVPQLDAGATCGQFPSHQCKGDLVCVSSATGSTNGTCGPAGGVGATCHFTNPDCVVGLTCDTMVMPPVCAARKQQGQPCSSSDQCDPRFLCVGISMGAGTCQTPIPKGGTCPGDGCLAPHQCVGGVCTPPPSIGDTCDKSCLTGYCDTVSHTCKARVAVGGACDTMSVAVCMGTAQCDPTSKTCMLCQ